ncbi:DNA-binding response regulator [Cytophagales bacterium WSM2-2]|nr:DNA-binding response regulator [Cytophagales bacterium WSM2-2]
MLKAIIVDDERSGREMLETLLSSSFSQRIKVVALCQNVDEGVRAIQTHSPDVVFLDIEMPNESGFELIEKVNPLSAAIVFVTAYSQHAVQAFKVNALDYLLKPVQREELERTITRLEKTKTAGEVLTQQDLLQKIMSFSAQPKVGLPSLNGMIFIEVKDIIRCEASDNYTMIFTNDKKYVISRILKEVEESLKVHNFLRVHKSHLVNLEKVIKYLKHEGGTLVLQGNAEVPVGRQAKEELERRLHFL